MSESIPIYKDNILYSMLSGHNFYKISELYNTNNKTKHINAFHVKDNVFTDIRIVDNVNLNTNISIDLWRRYISNPPGTANILWPIDIVDISTKQTKSSSLCGTYGLVFSKNKLILKNEKLLKELVYDDVQLDWREKHIQNLIKSLLNELKLIYDFGYSLVSFDCRKISYGYDESKELKVLFDFSFSTVKLDQYDSYHNQKFLANDICVDFIPPWFKRDNVDKDYKKRDKANISAEYYSIAAILFRLMIGRMPYQGKLMSKFADAGYLMTLEENEEAHINLMEKYIENPIFIFDKNDDSNHIGDIGDDDMYVERWESLNTDVQNMFLHTFSKDILENHQRKLYTISDWICALEKLFQE